MTDPAPCAVCESTPADCQCLACEEYVCGECYVESMDMCRDCCRAAYEDAMDRNEQRRAL
jgi:hypothetical protein